jgi:hypothetical protein
MDEVAAKHPRRQKLSLAHAAMRRITTVRLADKILVLFAETGQE